MPKEEVEDDDHEEKLIDQDMIFKAAMTSNFEKITDLSLVKEDITRLEPGSTCLKKLGPSLRRFDLSFNYIRKLDNLESLGNLRELNLNYNRIGEIDGL